MSITNEMICKMSNRVNQMTLNEICQRLSELTVTRNRMVDKVRRETDTNWDYEYYLDGGDIIDCEIDLLNRKLEM